MEEALIALILDDGGVTHLMGTSVWWGRAPQASTTYPRVVLRKVSGIPDYHLQGPSGLEMSRVQVDCYGATYTSAKASARAVRAVLSGYRGAVSGRRLQGGFIGAERDLPNEEDASGAQNLFAVSFDVTIWHD